MSLKYRQDHNVWNETKRVRSVSYDLKQSLPLHSLTSHGAQGVRATPPCASLDGQTYTRTPCRLFSLCNHWKLKWMFRSAPTLTNASSYDCTVRTAPYGLSACVPSVLLLSFRHWFRMDDVIYRLFDRCCTCMSQKVTAPKNEAARSGRTTSFGVYKAYASPMTYRRDHQVAYILTMSLQRPETTLFHGFPDQLQAPHGKDRNGLLFLKLYATWDWKVRYPHAARWGLVKGKPTAVCPSLA